MKFDVVVGNPPYQNTNVKGGKGSLWRSFIKKAFTLVALNGYVSICCPGFPLSKQDCKASFRHTTPLFLCNDASLHFPGVGSKIKYWLVQQGVHNNPFMVDGAEWLSSDDASIHPLRLSILNKIKLLPKFVCERDRDYTCSALKNNSTDYLIEPQGTAIHPIRHAARIKICYVSKPTACHYLNKVMMTFSGYPAFEYYDGKTDPISSCFDMSGYIPVCDAEEGSALIALYSSKLYKFLAQGDHSAAMRGPTNYSLPKVDLTKKWTDQELYEHFNLTPEEIQYVESKV